jgi:hypothetical protein
MQVIEVRCPHCSARLRLRDQSFVGRMIHCPDCAEPVSIERSAAGEVVATIATQAESEPKGKSRKTTSQAAAAHSGTNEKGASSPNAEAATKPTPSRKGHWITPQRVVWGVSSVLAVAIIAYAFSGPTPESTPREVATAPPVVPPAGQAPEPDKPPEVAPLPLPELPELPPINLQGLSDLVIAYRDRHGRFPAENVNSRSLPEAERLGWLAALAADREPNGPKPQWDQPMADPLNSRFVRRRQAAFLNPLTAEAAAEGLPATHFVGIAGVGRDAPMLPVKHPRAGIFGFERETTIADVRDGLSNTWLISGSSPRPVPWAAGGERTMRPLTQTPYINGPDGLGTGQVDGMVVLMADGSARFVSAETDPVVLRRMAAMNDGLPLDAAVPGEPGDVTPKAPPLAVVPPGPMSDIAQAAPNVEGLDQPILPQLAADRVLPPPPSYDVERALSQPIVRFSQVRPVPFGTLLKQVEELAGIPVRLDDAVAQRSSDLLAKQVSLELSDTNVGEILAALVKQAGLESRTDESYGVRLVPAGSE